MAFGSVIPRLDRGIQKKELDFPVKPENDNHWNRVRYELSPFYLFRSSICESGAVLQFEYETVFPVKVGLRAGMGQRPAGYLAIYRFDDGADRNL